MEYRRIIAGVPITEETLKNFPEVVEEVYGTRNLPEPIAKLPKPEELKKILDPSYQRHRDIFPWIFMTDYEFYSRANSHSPKAGSSWRGHFINDVIAGFERLSIRTIRRGAPKLTLDTLSAFDDARQVVEYAKMVGRDCVV